VHSVLCAHVRAAGGRPPPREVHLRVAGRGVGVQLGRGQGGAAGGLEDGGHVEGEVRAAADVLGGEPRLLGAVVELVEALHGPGDAVGLGDEGKVAGEVLGFVLG
jgi:hypothetical protein